MIKWDRFVIEHTKLLCYVLYFLANKCRSSISIISRYPIYIHYKGSFSTSFKKKNNNFICMWRWDAKRPEMYLTKYLCQCTWGNTPSCFKPRFCVVYARNKIKGLLTFVLFFTHMKSLKAERVAEERYVFLLTDFKWQVLIHFFSDSLKLINKVHTFPNDLVLQVWVTPDIDWNGKLDQS